MFSSELDLHSLPTPRSREGNQERAFITASRRKDRSLDCRLESANRASLLHKVRTGKAFYITKEIVEQEGMYEEGDERYQAKRTLKLQTRNLHIKERFYRHLLTGFPGRPIFHSDGQSIASRRASKLASRASFSGNPQRLRLDLSNISSSFSHGPPALASATVTADTHITSPNTPFDPNTPSCIACKSSLDDLPPSAATSGHMCSYITQQLSAPVRNTTAKTAKQRQQMPTSDQTLTLTHSLQIWQHQMTRQAQAPVDTAIQLLQYRNYLAPALELSLQHPASPQYDLSGSISYPTTDRHDHCQSCGHCQPSNNSHVLIHTAQLSQMPPTTSVSSPKTKVMSAETESISDFCPPYNTPLPLTTASLVTIGFAILFGVSATFLGVWYF